ncbi:hypothetical protein LINGRAHAP2_LOCUS7356 [Linum grandiflorum]
MEASHQRKEAAGLLHQILPPRLEDAGLEDCALPPDSIKEAFLKAASAVKSRATSIFSEDDGDGDCVKDPWPEEANDVSDINVGLPPVGGDTGTDALVGINEGLDLKGSCVKGGVDAVEEGRDQVVVVGGGVDDTGPCKGLEIGGNDEIGDDEQEKKKKKGPTLIGGFV